MGKRIKKPINLAAASRARAEFYRQHPELAQPKRQFVKATHPQYRQYRESWLSLYKKAGGKIYYIDYTKRYPARNEYDWLEPVAYDNPIRAVYILDGNDNNFLAANDIQHVNLPREAKWVNGEQITSIDRLSRTVRIRVQFTKASKQRFRVAMYAHTNNAAYTPNERTARASFSYSRQLLNANERLGPFTERHGDFYEGKTDENGVAIIHDFFEVTPAVGDRYKFIAWDSNGKQVESVEITTKRSIYYVTMSPNNTTDAVTHADLKAAIEPVYSDLHTNLIDLGHINFDWNAEYISTERFYRQAFIEKVKSESNQHTLYQPHLIRIIFANQITKIANAIEISPKITVQQDHIDNNQIVIDTGVPLWIGMGGDGQNTWHPEPEVQCFSYSQDQDPPVPPVIESYNAALFTAVQDVNHAGLYQKLNFDITNVDLSVGSEMRVMFSHLGKTPSGVALRSDDNDDLPPELPGATLIATKPKFVPTPVDKQISSIIHEIGHSLGMVASSGTSLDQPDT
ncbi:MAG: hypothetical protein ABG776_15480, partial [Cyanobacteria bacterium J06555_13]